MSIGEAGNVRVHASRIGFQVSADEDMKTIPFRDTVAGEFQTILMKDQTRFS